MTEKTGVQRGQIIEVEIESSGFEGRAVARLNGLVVFVRGAVPGDRVRAVIHKKRRRHVEATTQEVLTPSPHRVEPVCHHFGICGGCRWQDLDYSKQIEDKRQHVIDLLARIGDLEVEVDGTLASPSPYHYRNKMEFSFGTSRWLTGEEIARGGDLDRSFALGLHVPGRFDKLVDVQECHLQGRTGSRIVNRVRDLAREEEWSAYDCRRHTGFLRHLVLRSSHATGEILVALVTSRFDSERMDLFKRVVLDEFETVTSIFNIVNSTLSDVARGEEILLHGPGSIVERLHGLEFRVAPSTFFQTNTAQAERLYEVVREMVAPAGRSLLFDLYTGVGSIGLFLSDQVEQVVGFEENEESVRCARQSATQNGIDNATFYAEDAARAFSKEILQRHGQPDAIVLDPPRAGLSSHMIRGLLSSGCPTVAYVSCNPSTQARDLGLLKQAYRVVRVQPVDMFPQTPHIESAVLLRRSESAPKETSG